MIKNRESVHFLNLLYDHKDYTSFDNAFSIIMKDFPEPIGLQTNTSLEDGNKSEISIWEMDLLSLKKNGAKTVKKLDFPYCRSVQIRYISIGSTTYPQES